jgi:DNA-binding response OmpR family regulator
MPFRRVRELAMRILVIDDDRSVGTAIQTLLNYQCYEFVPVENGQLGVETFEASSFDSVLVDIFMPEVDGLATIKALRQRAPTVPIIAMSGFRFHESMGSTHDSLRMAASLGATYCLRKPFRSQQLMATINAHFDYVPPKIRAVGA